MMKFLFFLSLLVISMCVYADNFCDVSHAAPTYGMSFQEADKLVCKSKPKASAECGIIENIIGMRTGHIGEGHYKNVVLLADQDDEKFIAFAKSSDLTLFTFTSARREVFYVAVEGNYSEGSLLEGGAYFVKGLRDVQFPNGYSHRIFILENIL